MSSSRHDRDRRPEAARPAAMVALALARRLRAGLRLDPRRARGHDRRLDRADAPGEGHARPLVVQIGAVGAFYVGGAVRRRARLRLPHRPLGPQGLFMITLAVYIVATIASAFSWSAWSFFLFRFIAGAGIGGEYSAINSAIDELIPARVRGWVDLAINGSWWLGTAAGAMLSLVFLDTKIFRLDLGWRLTFGLGAISGIGVLITRRVLPESPRWLMIAAAPRRRRRSSTGSSAASRRRRASNWTSRATRSRSIRARRRGSRRSRVCCSRTTPAAPCSG